MKNILVTGGAGYIGSHVCKALKKAGYNPVTYDNLSTGKQHLVKWGPFEKGDILNEEYLTKIVGYCKIEAIIHLAAFIAVGESVKNPGKYYENNTLGGLNVIRAMCTAGINKIVFSSTAAVYGTPEKVPLTESSPTVPINPYGFSKYAVERMLADFSVSDNIKPVILRYFNVAGADPEGQTGCEHENPNNLIPILMNVLSGKQEYLEIFGTDYDTPDGTAIRDYIHVTDLADAHVKALDYLFNGGEGATCNLGTGKGHSVREVIESLERVTGKKVPVKNAARRAGDPPLLFADASKAKGILGWQAKFTSLDDITKTAWQWQLGNRV